MNDNHDSRMDTVLAGRKVEHCLRCGHWWFKRKAQRTVVCPWTRCKSPYWETESKREPVARERHFQLCISPDCVLLEQQARAGQAG
jgi:hypothetical protein